MTHRSYVDKIWIDRFIADEGHLLPADVSSRFFNVLRIKSDEAVVVFDGAGREVVGTLERNEKLARFRKASLVKHKPVTPKVIVAQAASDESKMKETIKRGSEFGVDEFVIFNAKRSEKFCYNKLINKQERLKKIAIDACRQSGRSFVPEIKFFLDLDCMVKSLSDLIDLKIFGHPDAEQLLSTTLNAAKKIDHAMLVVIGPEGGISDEECALLTKSQFIAVRFAPYTLRCELASLSAVAIFNAFCKRA